MLRRVVKNWRFGTTCRFHLQGSSVQEAYRTLNPWRWDGFMVLKRWLLTNLRCVTSQKTEEFVVSGCLCPKGTTRLPLDGFWWNLISETCSKISRKFKFHWNLTKIVYFTWTRFHIYDCLAELCIEWEIFQIKIVEKIKTHVLSSVTFFSQIVPAYEIMSKNVVEPKAADNMASEHGILVK